MNRKPLLLAILALELILCDYCFVGAVVAMIALGIDERGCEYVDKCVLN